MKVIRNPAIPQATLRSILRYDSETGVFTWITPPRNHGRMLGQEAGCIRTGYRIIKIGKIAYKAHRLAWIYVYGEMPPERIDHRDGNPLNNAIANLRIATQAQNCANARRWAGKALPKGVRRNRDKYTARISFEKELITIGTFLTPEEAANAYLREARRLYGEFARSA